MDLTNTLTEMQEHCMELQESVQQLIRSTTVMMVSLGVLMVCLYGILMFALYKQSKRDSKILSYFTMLTVSVVVFILLITLFSRLSLLPPM